MRRHGRQGDIEITCQFRLDMCVEDGIELRLKVILVHGATVLE
jgi:hypothetical protein